MKKHEVRKRIFDAGILPVVRAASPDAAVEVSRAICSGGIPILELTMTVPGAIDVIRELVRSIPGALIGAGTVLDPATADRCIDAGAQFIVSPGFDSITVQLVNDRNVLMIPGALTPTEVIRAWHDGSDLIKIFPCANVGGAAYIKALKTALPQIDMIPTGGVNLQNARAFFEAGAAAIGVGAELTAAKSVVHAAREFSALLEQLRDQRRKRG